MNVAEVLEKLFKNQMINIYRSEIFNIKKHLESLKDMVKIETYGLDFNDIAKKQNDLSYLDNEEVKYTDDGIKILLPIKEFWNDIKYYIPKNISKLEIPFGLIKDDLAYLKNFPNLKEISFNDYWFFEEEEFRKIYNVTKARNIKIKNPYVLNKLVGKSDIRCSI